jgi:exosortase H (IPTLxxWG-CTERM-specific)
VGGLLLENSADFLSPMRIRTAAVWTASCVHAVMAIFTDQAAVAGHRLYFKDFSIRVVFECLGAYEMVIFAAVVVAYPTTWKARAWGLLLGPFVIYIINVFRIGSLLVLGGLQPELFNFFHVYLWQSTLIAMVAVTWLAWLRLVVQR